MKGIVDEIVDQVIELCHSALNRATMDYDDATMKGTKGHQLGEANQAAEAAIGSILSGG